MVGMRPCGRFFLAMLFSATVLYLLLAKFLYKDTHLKTNTANKAVDEKSRRLLEDLGFGKKPKLYPQSYQDTADLPVLVMTLQPDQMDQFRRFIKSKLEYLRIRRLVIYELGLSEGQQKQARDNCYCQVRKIPWQIYPAHVKNKPHTKLHRSLLLQETLQEFGIVFWCHASMVFTSDDIYWPLVTAHKYGLAAWSTIALPTSAVTYPSVYRRFNTSQDNYFFHHMVDPEIAIYVNTARTHSQLLRPWVQCVLDPQCSLPRGAQTRSCKLHKPRYQYIGCHLYDTSVFNVILGGLFDFETPYRGKPGLFNITAGGSDKLPL